MSDPACLLPELRFSDLILLPIRELEEAQIEVWRQLLRLEKDHRMLSLAIAYQRQEAMLHVRRRQCGYDSPEEDGF